VLVVESSDPLGTLEAVKVQTTSSCPQGHRETTPGARFCTRCGQRLLPAEAGHKEAARRERFREAARSLRASRVLRRAVIHVGKAAS
jgi:hypothetical protein